jgi:hypothetical protein
MVQAKGAQRRSRAADRKVTPMDAVLATIRSRDDQEVACIKAHRRANALYIHAVLASQADLVETCG